MQKVNQKCESCLSLRIFPGAHPGTTLLMLPTATQWQWVIKTCDKNQTPSIKYIGIGVAMKALLSWHVQNFIVIHSLEAE